ncbi:hypothetical protein G4G28_12820 [Massilia sp. Dwa41.01b]|nr:hypothetical protein G4G28_12820 [Massilia sp. Dwa41.01b]
MARQELTYEEVAAAASRLQGEGRQVTIDTVRDALGSGTPTAIHRHLAAWRAEHAAPPAPPQAQLPEALLADLARWAQQFAEEAGSPAREALARHESDMAALREAGEALEAERDDLQRDLDDAGRARDEALATIAEREEEIERLNAELRNARQVAMDALVGKAKDQLAIEGKDAQLADLRQQLERNLAATATQSDARLAAEMELVGAATARDSLANEVRDLRAQIAALRKK